MSAAPAPLVRNDLPRRHQTELPKEEAESVGAVKVFKQSLLIGDAEHTTSSATLGPLLDVNVRPAKEIGAFRRLKRGLRKEREQHGEEPTATKATNGVVACCRRFVTIRGCR